MRLGVGFGRFVARMRQVGRRSILTVMRVGPGFFSGGVDYGMPGGTVMLTFAYGRLQTLRDHEPRDQQKSGHRWKSAPSIAPDHHVPIVESAYRFSNPAMALQPSHRQFGA